MCLTKATMLVVGVPSLSCGSWTLFICKHFLLFQWICTDDGHVSQNFLQTGCLLPVSRSWGGRGGGWGWPFCWWVPKEQWWRGMVFPSLAPHPKSPSLPFRAPLSLIPVSIKIISLYRFFYVLPSASLCKKNVSDRVILCKIWTRIDELTRKLLPCRRPGSDAILFMCRT